MKVKRIERPEKILERSVITVGVFDGVHLGHRKILERLRLEGEKRGLETVMVSFEPHPAKVVNPPIKILTTTEEKIMILSNSAIAPDWLVILQFNEKLARTGAEDFIRLYLKSSLGMKALVEGEDHRFGFKSEGDMKLHKNLSTIYEYDIILVPTFHINGYPVKSGKIRELIEKGEIVQAKRMLGGGYIIKGKVVPGDKIGRKLGFPTANISVCEDKLLPADGVYLVKTTINSTTYHGLLYIGYRPTITDKKEKRTELYLFNFNGELYNLALKVELIMKIREDRYFEDIQLLRKQMEEDRTYAMKLIKGPGGIND